MRELFSWRILSVKKNIVCSFTLTTHAYSFRTAQLFMLVTPSRVQTSFIVQPLCCTTVPPRIIQPPSRRLARIGGVFYVFILLIENEAGDPYIYTLDCINFVHTIFFSRRTNKKYTKIDMPVFFAPISWKVDERWLSKSKFDTKLFF